jgi:hypothetical protein
MEKTKRQKVTYEVITVDGTGNINGITQTVKLSNPAEIRFVCLSFGIGARCTINNQYQLQAFSLSTSGAGTEPYELWLKNNPNEIDITQYTIYTDCIVRIICKYYVGD